jgi:hypothetical protein
MINFNQIKWLVEAPKFDRTTDAFTWIAEKQISGDACYIHDLLRPQKIYYTTIHPDSSRWVTFKKCTIFNGYTDFDSLSATAHGKVAFMFWREEQAEFHHYEQVLQQHFVLLDTLFFKEMKTFILEGN